MRAPTAAADGSHSESPEAERRKESPRPVLLAIIVGAFLLFSTCALATFGLGSWIVRAVTDRSGTEANAGGVALAAWSADSAELTVAVSPSMAESLHRLADTFNSGSRRTPDGQVMRVSLTTMSSQEIVERSLGQAVFQAVAPDSSLWLRQIDRLWADQSPGGPNSLPPRRIGATTRFALSPIVVAVREEEAGRLGWPTREVGWREVFALALSDPDFAWSHPGADNAAGLAATLAEFYVGAGATRGLTEELAARDQVRFFVREVEKTVRRNGAPALADAAAFDAIVTQEQAVIALTLPDSGGLAAADVRFVAIYPREGTLWADHPFALLNLDGSGSQPLTGNQHRTYSAFAQFLLNEDSQVEMMRAGFRPADLTIDLDVPPSPIVGNSTVDPSQPKVLLPYPSALVMQLLLTSWREAWPPANILLVVDTSESMAGEKLAQAKETLSEFIDQLQEDHDRLGLIGLGSGMTNGGELRRLDGEGRERFRLQFETMQASGYTALVDSVLEAQGALQRSAHAEAVNVILVMSDGRDNHSEYRLRRLQRAMHDAAIPVLIHTVAFGGDANERLLRDLARAGGGLFHRAASTDSAELYRLIATHKRAED